MAVGQNPGTPVNIPKAFKIDYLGRVFSSPKRYPRGFDPQPYPESRINIPKNFLRWFLKHLIKRTNWRAVQHLFSHSSNTSDAKQSTKEYIEELQGLHLAPNRILANIFAEKNMIHDQHPLDLLSFFPFALQKTCTGSYPGGRSPQNQTKSRLHATSDSPKRLSTNQYPPNI